MSSQESAQTLALKYLQGHNVLCLATTNQNQPWVAAVFYAIHEGGLIFLSAPHTRHSQAIKNNLRVAASVQEDYQNWNEIKGVQLEGAVHCVAGDKKASVIDCYSGKFPIVGVDAPAAIARALDKVMWFRLIPDVLYFIDNSKGLGHRSEIDPAILL